MEIFKVDGKRIFRGEDVSDAGLAIPTNKARCRNRGRKQFAFLFKGKRFFNKDFGLKRACRRGSRSVMLKTQASLLTHLI